MHSTLSSFTLSRLLAVGLVLGLAWSTRAQSDSTPRTRRSMEFSQPRGEVTTTNFEQEASQKPAVRDLDPSSLKMKPADIFGTQDSLDGLLAPSLQRAPSPTIQSKKA